MNAIEYPFASLPDEAKSVIWMLFGEGESPLTPKTAFEAIAPTAYKHVSPENRDRIIAEFSSWFGRRDGQDLLKEDLKTSVDEALLEGVRGAISEGLSDEDEVLALWAVGYVDTQVAESIIRRCWSSEETVKFAEHVVSALKSLDQRQALINPARVMRVDVGGVTAESHLVQRERRLFSYRDLRHSGIWLYEGVRHIVELLVNLDAASSPAMSQIGNPVLQTYVSELRMRRLDSDEPGSASRWITGDASDATIALSIVEVIDRVNELDSDLRRGIEPEHERSETELVIASLLENLVDELASVEPAVSAGWICDLLEYAASAFYAFGVGEKPHRLTQLEAICVSSLARLLNEHWSQRLLNEFRESQPSAPYTPRILPVAEAALRMLDSHPSKAYEIARMIMDTFEQRVEATVSGDDRLFYRLGEWRDQEWIFGVGISLAICDGDLDLDQWVLRPLFELGLERMGRGRGFRTVPRQRPNRSTSVPRRIRCCRDPQGDRVSGLAGNRAVPHQETLGPLRIRRHVQPRFIRKFGSRGIRRPRRRVVRRAVRWMDIGLRAPTSDWGKIPLGGNGPMVESRQRCSGQERTRRRHRRGDPVRRFGTIRRPEQIRSRISVLGRKTLALSGRSRRGSTNSASDFGAEASEDEQSVYDSRVGAADFRRRRVESGPTGEDRIRSALQRALAYRVYLSGRATEPSGNRRSLGETEGIDDTSPNCIATVEAAVRILHRAVLFRKRASCYFGKPLRGLSALITC